MDSTTTFDDQFEGYNSSIRLCSLAGIIIVIYSTYVKWQLKKNPKYRALCDFNESMSCTRVLSSKYSSGFGIVGKLVGEKSKLNLPNTMLGLVFYCLQVASTYMNQDNEIIRQFSLYSGLTSIIGSIYLAYILYFKLKDFCLVCNLSYVVNTLIFYYNWKLCSLKL